MTALEVVKLLGKNGWVRKNQKGSHFHMIHPKRKGKITIPRHGGDIAPGTLHSILKQAGLK